MLPLMVWYGVRPGAGILLLPLLIAFLVLTSFSVALWTSALTVRYRDMRYLMPFATQMLLFLTPVAYPASMLPDRFRVVYGLNPMATIVEGFKSSLLGTPQVSGPMLLLSAAVVTVAFVTGATYFRAVENSIVDHL
jgi:lipopolysaccharide transport system permease protein